MFHCIKIIVFSSYVTEKIFQLSRGIVLGWFKGFCWMDFSFLPVIEQRENVLAFSFFFFFFGSLINNTQKDFSADLFSDLSLRGLRHTQTDMANTKSVIHKSRMKSVIWQHMWDQIHKPGLVYPKTRWKKSTSFQKCQR